MAQQQARTRRPPWFFLSLAGSLLFMLGLLLLTLQSLREPYAAAIPATSFTQPPVQYRAGRGEQWSAWRDLPFPAEKGCPALFKAERWEFRLRPGLEGTPLAVYATGIFPQLSNREVVAKQLAGGILVTGHGEVAVSIRWGEGDPIYFCRLLLEN